MAAKYLNGLWKNTSRKQDRAASALFECALRENIGCTMSTNFDQKSGICTCTLNREDSGEGGLTIMQVSINRDGQMLKPMEAFCKIAFATARFERRSSG